nr:centriole, cilia and spindle-associated protein [Columba livia]
MQGCGPSPGGAVLPAPLAACGRRTASLELVITTLGAGLSAGPGRAIRERQRYFYHSKNGSPVCPVEHAVLWEREKLCLSPRGLLFDKLEKEREDQEKQQKEEQEKTVEHTSVKEADKTSRTGHRPSRSALSSRNDRRSAKSPQKTDAPKENKHPFALYGWGERQTDTGSQKTHNVCASASANEIHESALRAKNRRQVEKRKLSQRRVQSAEAEKSWRIKPSPPDNPWMTEYMRCYSARAR